MSDGFKVSHTRGEFCGRCLTRSIWRFVHDWCDFLVKRLLKCWILMGEIGRGMCVVGWGEYFGGLTIVF